MQGHVISYNSRLKEGMLMGDDNITYYFFFNDWKESILPKHGQHVFFDTEKFDRAANIFFLSSIDPAVLKQDRNNRIQQQSKTSNNADDYYAWSVWCLKKENYANFEGRAQRSEYWYFMSETCMLFLIAGHLADILDRGEYIIYTLLAIYVVPVVASSVRRLHDINRSGWWFLLLLTFIGWIPLFLFLYQRSDPNTNQWGDPHFNE